MLDCTFRVATHCSSALLVLWVVICGAHAQPLFTPLGYLPGDPTSTNVTVFGVSADGSVVVGQGTGIEGPQGFRWEDGVMTGIGDLPGGTFASNAWATSADGSVIVGRGTSENGTEAFRWEDGVITPLGDLPGGGFLSFARDVSADGSVVVGQARHGAGTPPYTAAFRWTAQDGMTQLPDLPGGSDLASAHAVSTDGQFVVGRGANSDNRDEAIRWTNGVPEGLGTPSGYIDSRGYDLSADGRTVAGHIRAPGMTRAGRWREGEGWTVLADYPGGSPYGEAITISGDGRVLGGTAEGPLGFTAVLWTETEVFGVKERLEALGLDLTGWRLTVVIWKGLSYDGTVVVGTGINPAGEPQSWRAEFPPWPVAAELEAPSPDGLHLTAAPNPVRGQSTVRVQMPEAGPIQVAVYDLLGRRVATLQDGPLAAGTHALRFEARDLPSGVYLVRAVSPSGLETTRLTVLD